MTTASHFIWIKWLFRTVSEEGIDGGDGIRDDTYENTSNKLRCQFLTSVISPYFRSYPTFTISVTFDRNQI